MREGGPACRDDHVARAGHLGHHCRRQPPIKAVDAAEVDVRVPDVTSTEEDRPVAAELRVLRAEAIVDLYSASLDEVRECELRWLTCHDRAPLRRDSAEIVQQPAALLGR